MKERPTHCSRGHEFTPENSYERPTTGQLMCRKCSALRSRGTAKRLVVKRRIAKAERMSREPTTQELADRLSPRVRKMVAGVIAGKPMKQAANEAGYLTPSAAVIGSQVMARPNVRAYYRALLEDHGIGDNFLAEKAKELMTAKAYGLTKDGRVVEMGPDGATQFKAMELSFKVMDAFPNPKLDVDMKVAQVVVFREEELLGADPFLSPIDVTPEGSE